MCQAGFPFALFVGRPLNRGLADVVLLVPFLYASVQTLAPCTAHSSLHAGGKESKRKKPSLLVQVSVYPEGWLIGQTTGFDPCHRKF